MGLSGDLAGWFSNPLLSPKRKEMPVYYKCKFCERSHPCPITFRDEESFDSSTLWCESFLCPVKGESALYDKEDMFWKD
jgi:hypothetical protein